MSSQNERQRIRIEWRRSKVLELSSQGHSQPEISRILRVSLGTVNKDLSCLRQQAQQNLQKHIQHKLPEEYQRCLTGINRVLKLSWQIANSNNMNDQEDSNGNKSITMITEKDKIRLQAAALANDCYKYIMDLTTNGVVITDAIKHVQASKEKLTMSTKIEENQDDQKNHEHHDEDDYEDHDDDVHEDQQEEQETINQVF